MSPESLEMVECLGSWLSNGHVPNDGEHQKAITAAIIGEFEDLDEDIDDEFD